ncbi:MAG: tRNA (N(6)-L-threonylcarbamoyladenosine(37)-C(2))-methylthiotransferase MtaB [Dehalococcoidia bacterium]|nr:tRNA (N(6)-L-threonylcarbamoyladenosine(37)-C(2))-methylthiotransferase MtaB [Dehalococcoidia bacterium]
MDTARTMTLVYIETHGCKLNQADSQALARRFAEAGYRMVDDPAQADVCVVNTCTVTHVADRKARRALSAVHRANPGALLVATGCYAQRAPERLAQVEGVGLVLGNTQKDNLLEQVNRLVGLAPLISFDRLRMSGIIASGPRSTDTILHEQAPAPGHTRATVKIQEGCNQVCAYCIVPKVRGRERSLHPDALVAQIQRLAAEGYQEVVLTGTQLGTYGFDLPGASLTGLIRRLLEKTSVPRLRVSSLQPQEISDELLALWENPRLCPHFHLPLQSGSAEVLKAMHRRYSPRQYVQAAESIRQRVARAAITTDIIVGFPGETAQQFQETHDLCRNVEFSGLNAFPYSQRPGTSAAHLSLNVAEPEKRHRMDVMLAQARGQARRYRQTLMGTICPVLWETSRSVAGDQVWAGLTDSYVRVATWSTEPLHNRITPVVMEHQEREVVWGRVIHPFRSGVAPQQCALLEGPARRGPPG